MVEIQYNNSPKKSLPYQFKTLLGIFLLLLFWQIISLLIFPKSSTQASDLTVEEILIAVNNQRTLRNLSALNTDGRLSAAARYKAGDMQARHYFSHTDPEGNYIWNKIVAEGYTPYLQLGENLAIEFYNTESLVAAWMNSPTHRANLLNEGFKDQGMGVNLGRPEQGQYYSAIANTFGALIPTKKSAPPAPTPTPPPPPPPPPKTNPLPKPPQPTPLPTVAQPASQPIETAKATSSEPAPLSSKPPAEPLRTSLGANDKTQLAQNFSLPQKSTPTQTRATPTALSAPVIGKTESQRGPTAYQINRYLIMGLGAVLLLMVISDLKKRLEQKFHAYDKIINNLVLLILSLIVISLMYWL